jgi:hypothetical protein
MPFWSEDQAAHVVTFRVFTPNGHLYQEVRVVHRPESSNDEVTLIGSFPVAGTAIATNSLYGRWKVVPYLDRNAVACAAASFFTIAE